MEHKNHGAKPATNPSGAAKPTEMKKGDNKPASKSGSKPDKKK